MAMQETVYVVDGDRESRESLCRLLIGAGIVSKHFCDGPSFLGGYDPTGPRCLLLDVCVPGQPGLEPLRALTARGMPIPIIVVSACRDPSTIIGAMRAGAVDFITKPFDPVSLLDTIRGALKRDRLRCKKVAQQVDAAARLALLTPREVEVMSLMIIGRAAREVAGELGISRKTVQVHRSNMMNKLDVRSLVELIRLSQDFDTENGSTIA